MSILLRRARVRATDQLHAVSHHALQFRFCICTLMFKDHRVEQVDLHEWHSQRCRSVQLSDGRAQLSEARSRSGHHLHAGLFGFEAPRAGLERVRMHHQLGRTSLQQLCALLLQRGQLH